ncbi:hypothetical protein V6767_03730 [Martelella sp. FLE1502]
MVFRANGRFLLWVLLNRLDGTVNVLMALCRQSEILLERFDWRLEENVPYPLLATIAKEIGVTAREAEADHGPANGGAKTSH